MNVNHLIRDAAKVHAACKEVGDSLVAVHPCKIYIPEHYTSASLCTIDDVIRIVGIFGMTVDDKYYATSNACTLMEIKPSTTNTVDIHGEKYLEFGFIAGDTIIKNLNLIRIGTLVYRIYNEIISKGKVPWYITMEDHAVLFETALSHGNAKLGADAALLELLTVAMCRQKEDRAKFFRHDPRLNDPHSKIKPIFVPLKSVAYQSSNTTAKLLGAHFNEGLTSALVNKSERNESIEDILRQ